MEIVEIYFQANSKIDPFFRCQIQTCPVLKPPKNGRFVHYPCSNVFNSACGIQCNPGFELQGGSSVRMCLPNGQWSGSQPRYSVLSLNNPKCNLESTIIKKFKISVIFMFSIETTSKLKIFFHKYPT